MQVLRSINCVGIYRTMGIKMAFCKFLVLFFSGLFFSINVFSNENKCEKIEVPIVFDQYGLPTIELIINGKSNFVLLDLGSATGIHLPISEISGMPGVKYTGEISNSTNISGETFSAKEFLIPMLAIECMTFENISGYELNPWGVSIGDKPKGMDDDQQIVIGQGFFADKTILIDYANKNLTINKNKIGTGSSKSNNTFIPYVLSDEGITIQMSSSIAQYQMVLDTGATSSIFSVSKVNIKEPLTACDFSLGPDIKCEMFTSTVNIGGYSFVSNILLYPIDPRFTKDGLLGGDFFNKFIVELNFSNKNIVLTPSEPSAL